MKIRVLNDAALKLAISFSVLGAVSAIPAAADTLNLNTGRRRAYTITADTLRPRRRHRGTIQPPGLGAGWASDSPRHMDRTVSGPI